MLFFGSCMDRSLGSVYCNMPACGSTAGLTHGTPAASSTNGTYFTSSVPLVTFAANCALPTEQVPGFGWVYTTALVSLPDNTVFYKFFGYWRDGSISVFSGWVLVYICLRCYTGWLNWNNAWIRFTHLCTHHYRYALRATLPGLLPAHTHTRAHATTAHSRAGRTISVRVPYRTYAHTPLWYHTGRCLVLQPPHTTRTPELTCATHWRHQQHSCRLRAFAGQTLPCLGRTPSYLTVLVHHLADMDTTIRLVLHTGLPACRWTCGPSPADGPLVLLPLPYTSAAFGRHTTPAGTFGTG